MEMDNLEKHFVATGFVVNKDRTKMLMVYHKKLGKWLAPGGHLEQNETPGQAARREVKEETGIDVEIIDSSHLEVTPEQGEELVLETPLFMLAEHIPAHKDKEAHIHLDFIFLCEADENQPIKRQEEEVEGARWMTWEEISNIDTFNSISGFAKTML